MGIYRVDFRRLMILLLPTRLRTASMVAWLDTNLIGVKTVYRRFLNYRKIKKYELAHNSQVCYLEAVLNDAFDVEERRIYIKNGLFFRALEIYSPAEARPEFIALPVRELDHIYSLEDLERGATDFVVQIPRALRPANQEAFIDFKIDVTALVNKYKLASKTFKLVYE